MRFLWDVHGTIGPNNPASVSLTVDLKEANNEHPLEYEIHFEIQDRTSYTLEIIPALPLLLETSRFEYSGSPPDLTSRLILTKAGHYTTSGVADIATLETGPVHLHFRHWQTFPTTKLMASYADRFGSA
jgi:hypothetical protein